MFEEKLQYFFQTLPFSASCITRIICTSRYGNGCKNSWDHSVDSLYESAAESRLIYIKKVYMYTINLLISTMMPTKLHTSTYIARTGYDIPRRRCLYLGDSLGFTILMEHVHLRCSLTSHYSFAISHDPQLFLSFKISDHR